MKYSNIFSHSHFHIILFMDVQDCMYRVNVDNAKMYVHHFLSEQLFLIIS